MQVSVVQFRPWAPTQKFGFDSVPFFPKKPNEKTESNPAYFRRRVTRHCAVHVRFREKRT
jgi:hypothetical protein